MRLPVVAGLLSLAACGSDPLTRVAFLRPQFERDRTALSARWNAADLAGFVAGLSPDLDAGERAHAVDRLAALRERLGPITHQGAGVLDPRTGDARILAVARHVLGTENGVAAVRLAYGRDQRVVALAIDGLPVGGR